MFLTQLQTLDICAHRTAAQASLAHGSRDQTQGFSRSRPSKPLESLLTWNHREPACLKCHHWGSAWALVQQWSDRPVSWEGNEAVTDACCKLAAKSTLGLFFSLYEQSYATNTTFLQHYFIHGSNASRLPEETNLSRAGIQNEQKCLQNPDSSTGQFLLYLLAFAIYIYLVTHLFVF